MYIKIQKYDRLLNILCIKLDHSTHLGSDLSCPTYIVMVPPTCIMSVTNLCTVNHQHVYCQSPTCVLSVINLCTVSHQLVYCQSPIVYCQSPTCVLSVTNLYNVSHQLCTVSHQPVYCQSPTCVLSVINLCTVSHQLVYCVINLCTVSHQLVYCQSPTCVLSVTNLCTVSWWEQGTPFYTWVLIGFVHVVYSNHLKVFSHSLITSLDGYGYAYFLFTLYSG